MKTPSSVLQNLSLNVMKVKIFFNPLNINISDSCICSNLSCARISIGQEKDSIDASIALLREATTSSMHNVWDKKMLNLENELKDIEQEEDLDKILLNQLCGEIMDEVMDLEECSDDVLTNLGSKTSKKRYKKKLNKSGRTNQ
jgi:hypothetical protein